MLSKLKPFASLCLSVGMLIILACSSLPGAVGKENAVSAAADLGNDAGTGRYLGWLAEHPDWKDASNAVMPVPLALQASTYSGASDKDRFEWNGEERGLLWQDDGSWIEWKVDVPQDGYYNIGVIYDSANDSGIDMVRGVQIDGAYPYEEAKSIDFKRSFVDRPSTPAKDEFGNDIRPGAVEVKGWKDVRLTDYSVDPEPLKWYLEKGSHVIRFIAEREPMRLKSIYLATPIMIPSYKQYAASLSQKEATANSGSGKWRQIVEGEHYVQKSNASIQLQSMDSALMSPSTHGLIRYNAVGGEQFRKKGQWIEWQFEVPRDGIYQIGFKYLQAYLNNSYAYRTITIDGQTPFRELLKVGFPYSKGWEWSGKPLDDEQEKPYDLYLTRGKHTIRTTAQSGPIKPVYDGLLRNLSQIGKLEQEIRKITGNFDKTFGVAGNVDLNRDWELDTYIPDLQQRMTDMIDDLRRISDYMANITIGQSDTENAFRSAAADLADLRDHPRTIAGRMNVFQAVQNNLALWTFRLLDQSLAFDYMWVAEPGADLPDMNPSFYDKAANLLAGFYHSFTVNYDFNRNNPQAITVWVNRNRDYVEMMRQLADETFTAKTGIPVNINIVPDPQMLILGNIAGIQPDIALGLDQTMPVDFASRGALLDLSVFPDYGEVAKRFHPTALNLFHYDGNNYALPETQGFNVLVYRTDILHALDAEPPDIWDDLTKLLPTLQQNGYDFYIPSLDSLPFITQNGGSFYTAGGMTTALDEEAGFQGFQKWTDMFTLYQLPKQIPSFYTHFRLGDIPIGIVDFNTYLQIQFAAPELAGKWKAVPIPGTKQPDGQIARWSGGPLQAGIIFKKTKKPNDAWSFLKWWTSTETQTRFGNEVEMMLGSEYRWNTANMEAFKHLPWPKEDLRTILAQWKWFTAIPQVPGGYFTQRQLEFAWNKTVLSGLNARESFEQSIIDINREMERKQVEFGLRDKDGHVIRELDVPLMNVPWEGGSP